MNYPDSIGMRRNIGISVPIAWCAVTSTLTGFVLNEVIGPTIIFLSLMLWIYVIVGRALEPLRQIRRSEILLPMCVPVLALLSTLWSNDPSHTFRMSLELILTAGLGVLITRVVSPRHLLVICVLATLSALIPSIFVRNMHFDFTSGTVSWAGVFANKNTLAACGAICGLASFAIYFDGSRSAWSRGVAIACGLFGLIVAVLARSIAVLLALSIAGVILFAVSSSASLSSHVRSAYLKMISLIGVIVGSVVAIGVLFFSDELLRLVGKDSTLTGRTELWMWANRFAADHPVLGVGYQAFWIQGNPLAEAMWDRFHIAGKFGFHFHSLYYETLIELGFVGVLVAAASLGWSLVKIWQAAIKVPNSTTGFFLAFFVMMLITQVQGLDMFTIFHPWYAISISAVAYAQRETSRTGVSRG